MGDWQMDQWSAFIQDKWLLIIVAIVVLFLVMKLVKTFVKWILVLAVIAAVLYYGSTYAGNLDGLKTSISKAVEEGNLSDLRTSLGKAAADEAKQQFTSIIAGEGKNADYIKHDDGSFTVHTNNLNLDVKPGSDVAEVSFFGQSYKVSINKTIQKFIDEAKQNQ
jgi:hypothetical protein